MARAPIDFDAGPGRENAAPASPPPEIIFVTIPQTMDMLLPLWRAPEELRLFVLGCFYPIFYLLFGVGFGLFLRSADRPRLLLVRRSLALARCEPG